MQQATDTPSIAHERGPQQGLVSMSSSSEATSLEPEGLVVAVRETKAIRWIRVLFLGVVISTMAIITFIIFTRLRAREEEAFDQGFEELADTILDAAVRSTSNTLGEIDTLTFEIESFARSSMSLWPFVTLPEFAHRAQKFVGRTDLFYAGMHNLVSEEDRVDWENYTVHNSDWMFEVEELQNLENPDVLAQWDVIHDVQDQLSNNRVNGTAKPGPYLPSWQNYPVTNSPYNFNALQSQRGPEFLRSLTNQTVVFSSPFIPQTESLIINLTFAWFDRLQPNVKNAFEPVSAIYYPVADRIQNGNTVGVFVSFFYWRDVLTEVLPLGTAAVDVVLEMCGEAFTYRIAGPEAIYLGSGDLHDRGYPFDIGGSLIELDKVALGRFPVDNTYCLTNIKVYPTFDLENVFITRTPTMFAVAIMLSALLILLLFVVCDIFVERRQRVVLQKLHDEILLQRETNEKLVDANETIARSSEAQLKHFACMSHEIRTPLNCIIGCVSFTEDWKLDPSQQETISMIKASSSLLLSVVNDVLDYSRLESGNVDIEMVNTPLQRAVDLVLSSMSSSARSQQKQIVSSFTMNLPQFIYTDIRRFQQILYNLLGNAVKFSQAGNDVELRLSVSTSKCVQEERAYSPRNEKSEEKPWAGSWLRICVKDSGKGIDPKHFKQIFEAFSQDNEDKENIYGGSGLGLAITTKLVHRMGGQIFVSSQPGVGSEFSVCLPVAEQELAQSADIQQAIARVRNLHVVVALASQKKEVDYLADLFRHHQIDFSVGTTNLIFDNPPMSKDLFLIADKDLSGSPDSIPAELMSKFAGCLVLGQSETLRHYPSFSRMLPHTLLLEMSSSLDISSKKSRALSVIKHSTSTIEEAAIPHDRIRVLIAEDNLVNQKVLKRLLQRIGVQHIDIVGNGLQAVEAEAAKSYDIIFMDLQMPIMDGVEACRAINQRDDTLAGTHPLAKVVFVTAHVLSDQKQKCDDAGGLDFISKPCTLEAIRACFVRVSKVIDFHHIDEEDLQ